MRPVGIAAVVIVLLSSAPTASASPAAGLAPAGPAPHSDRYAVAGTMPPPSSTFRERLDRLPGVRVLGTNRFTFTGYRIFELTIRQPLDHHRPHGATFRQHLELYHRGLRHPMVMYVPGYYLYTSYDPTETYLSDAATITGANQISVEHRFFGRSVPRPRRWSALTVWQEAADEHHIERVFKQLYHRPWIGTGTSKGGETVIFHDYFFPNDFAGTFARSAPSITATFTHHYDRFLDRVGTAKCRRALLDVQRFALRHRVLFERWLRREAGGRSFHYWRHGLDQALENAIVFAPFGFWQYGGNCRSVPTARDGALAIYAWLDDDDGLLYYTDELTRPFLAYNYQAGTQLGYPIVHLRSKLGRLLHYGPRAQHPQQNLPPSIPDRPLSQRLMRTIHRWVSTDGRRLLLLYGARDPFAAEPFELGHCADCARFTVPRGNHVSRYVDLPKGQERMVVRTLRRWAGVGPRNTPYAPPSPIPALATEPLFLP